jgi:flagellar hook-associated protein 1 FlgK
MSGLFGSLAMATRSMEAQRLALDVVGQNMANVNTAGYSRREIDFAEIPPYGRLNAGEGVEVEGIRAVRDQMLERRYRLELPEQAKSSTIADSLSVVQTALGTAGESVDARLTAFFDAFSTLATDPTSSSARQQVVLQGQTLAGTFRDMAERLDTAQRDTNASVVGAVDDVNALVKEIARLNIAIGGTGGTGADAQSLKDQQGEAIRKLTGLLDVSVMAREDGGVDVTVANGNALVLGGTNYDMAAVPTGTSGLAQVWLNGKNVTSTIDSGKIGGLLQVRDAYIPAYMSDIDAIAYQVVNQVNTLHDAGYDLNGVDAGRFFDALATPAGAARNMTVTAAIVADPSLVAASGTLGTGGDNQTARGISALRDARVLAGNTATFNDGWGRVIYRAGSDAAAATSDAKSRAGIVRQIEALRDSTSGVSLDEEAMSMLKFQRAYEANAKFFTTVNSALDILMGMLRL